MSSRVATIICWGSNTDVGKTLVSAALARAARTLSVPVCYVKPVQTGIGSTRPGGGREEQEKLKGMGENSPLSLEDIWTMDGTKVAHALSAMHCLLPHAAASTSQSRESPGAAAELRMMIAPPSVRSFDEMNTDGRRDRNRDGDGDRDGARVSTFFGWNQAVSPHLAVEREGRPVSDEEILRAIEIPESTCTSCHSAPPERRCGIQ